MKSLFAAVRPPTRDRSVATAGTIPQARRLGARGGRTWLALGLALLAAWAAPPSARADSTVMVLSVRPLDNDDALAGRLSAALRTAAANIEGWTVSDREVSLAQMSLAHGCQGTTATCMADIAQTLAVDRLIYGSSETTAKGVRLQLYNFDAVTGHVEGSYEQTVRADALAPGAIDATARTIALHLAGEPPTGAIMVTSNLMDGDVIVDGKPMGSLGGQGERLVEDVPAGSHVVAVQSAGQNEQLDVEVQAGETAMAHVELVPPAPMVEPEPAPVAPPPTERGHKGLRVTGWILVGTAGALLGAAAGVWGRIGAINKDADLEDYRAMFPSTTTDVCVPAHLGNPGDGTKPGIAQRVASLCDSGQALEKAQWGLLAGSIATAVLGTSLLVVARKKERAPTVSFAPHVWRGEAGLSARVSF